jgi:L-2-hydroxyglutarate oxidase
VSPSTDADFIVVGTGIVGLATARALLRRHPGSDLMVLDKEPSIAAHQSGHNSGVIHAGLYYRPGSEKAVLCRSGRTELMAFCRDHGIAVDGCGKVVVATRPDEISRLADLRVRATSNGIPTSVLSSRALAIHEPHVDGMAALLVPETAVVDFREVCRALADEVVGLGGQLGLDRAVLDVTTDDERATVTTAAGPMRARFVVNCGGLHSDQLASAVAGRLPGRIVAFRGEYFSLADEASHLVRHLVYPVPDPRFPFLGVHLTRGIDGHVHAGPNAVLALGRESYDWRTFDVGEVVSYARDPGVRRMARRYWRTGIGEMVRSVSLGRFARAVQRLVPDIEREHLVKQGSGVRAQLVAPDGSLVDDFAFVGDGRVLHVLNAPSPAATASLAIGDAIVDRLAIGSRA